MKIGDIKGKFCAIWEKMKKKKPGAGLPVVKVGPNRKAIGVLWGILIVSVIFGVYKNFTAADTEIIREREIVEEKIKDTNAVESFVKKFAMVYHSWGNTQEEIADRKQAITFYLTDALSKTGGEMITTDCPVTASVTDVCIWSFAQKENGEYEVCYSVRQELTEDEQQAEQEGAYQVTVHADEDGGMVIVRNPTACAMPGRSAYQPPEKVADGSVDSAAAAEIEEFLNTFFGLYPSATDKELTYYVKGGALKAIDKNYVYGGLVNPVILQEDGKIKAYIYVRYLDQDAKVTQTSQYALTLEKVDENWKIVKAE